MTTKHDPTGDRCARINADYECAGCGENVHFDEAHGFAARRSLRIIRKLIEVALKADEDLHPFFFGGLVALCDEGLDDNPRRVDETIGEVEIETLAGGETVKVRL